MTNKIIISDANLDDILTCLEIVGSNPLYKDQDLPTLLPKMVKKARYGVAPSLSDEPHPSAKNALTHFLGAPDDVVGLIGRNFPPNLDDLLQTLNPPDADLEGAIIDLTECIDGVVDASGIYLSKKNFDKSTLEKIRPHGTQTGDNTYLIKDIVTSSISYESSKDPEMHITKTGKGKYIVEIKMSDGSFATTSVLGYKQVGDNQLLVMYGKPISDQGGDTILRKFGNDCTDFNSFKKAYSDAAYSYWVDRNDGNNKEIYCMLINLNADGSSVASLPDAADIAKAKKARAAMYEEWMPK